MIDLVADPGTFEPWDSDVVSNDPLAFHDTMSYRTRLLQAERHSGSSEAIVAGRASVQGRAVVLIAGEFSFLGGTLGVAAAERVIRAFDRATESRLPVVAMPVSGGTRMQEGAAGFIQMAGCAAAVQRLRDAGLLYVVYLRNPTTGGVLGSWASLAHVRLAEPGALIGLTGPRVVRAVTGHPLPAGVQTAENLGRRGLLDEIVRPSRLRERLGHILDAADPRPGEWQAPMGPEVLGDDADVAGWDAVVESRRAGRPGVADVLRQCGADVVRLRGDGAGNDDENCIVGMGRVCGIAAMVLAQRRNDGGGARGASIGAVGYRQYRRAIALADELGLPLVGVIDTRGAAMTPHDEEGGVAAMIAACLGALSVVRTPTLSVLLGEGSGGGALALLPADRVVAAEHGWLAPISPEGASAILYRTTERAADVAGAQRISSTDLRRLGIVDTVVPDGDGAMAPRIAAVIGDELRRLAERDDEERLDARRRRYRTVAR
ncbi:MAG: acetyl-CoA carboxyl transferase [Nitriliruptorales bacterium]|nr:acetyl-CoA carboxyl transferase [Nitriliruptorales bacterium]